MDLLQDWLGKGLNPTRERSREQTRPLPGRDRGVARPRLGLLHTPRTRPIPLRHSAVSESAGGGGLHLGMIH